MISARDKEILDAIGEIMARIEVDLIIWKVQLREWRNGERYRTALPAQGHRS